MNLRRARTTLSIGLVFWVFSSQAYGFAISPMSVTFEPSGKESSRSFLIENNGPEKVPVQISVTTREISIDGQEKNVDADEDFIVYPPQLVLNPNDKRTVRVTWAGKTTPDKELAYRLIAEQMPVATEKKEAAKGAVIKMLLRYMAAIYIAPKKAAPKVEIVAAEKSGDKTGDRLVLTFENTGTAHQILRDLRVNVTTTNTVALTESALQGVTGQNILAQSKRRFVLPWPKELAKPTVAAPIKASFEANP